jgi:hypothetical protein
MILEDNPENDGQKGAERVAKKNQKDTTDGRVVGFVGVGLDNKDGHQRLTQSEHFFLVGGSAETHEHMQDVAIRFAEALARSGKRLQDTPIQETLDMLNEARDS